ncbi:hypothetical protein BURCENBC7_AP0450 [Burkholderia cenocepacia BC7]|nr:uncharacterized protein BCN122_II1635 [Burkholderia cenocepacia]EPZ89349.1 hypothetical protein BURCENK562V_C3671 [Burkholderia cenocepacia K56-2Valvano]ERI29077.1 hypothetical protein BURCENBC7_AP0450 [Burkholderia cenocepacia BC7]
MTPVRARTAQEGRHRGAMARGPLSASARDTTRGVSHQAA